MKAKVPVHLVELKIDGRAYSCRAVDFLYQRDPYPGGHEYELRISNVRTKARFRGIDSGRHIRPSDELRFKIQFQLTALLAESASLEQEPSDVQFFLNTIDEVTINDNEIFIQGVCSEVVKEADF
jgi:hypothetical protein